MLLLWRSLSEALFSMLTSTCRMVQPPSHLYDFLSDTSVRSDDIHESEDSVMNDEHSAATCWSSSAVVCVLRSG